MERLKKVLERLASFVGEENILLADVRGKPDTLVLSPLGSLAERSQGGVLVAVGVAVDHHENCILKRLDTLFPIIESWTTAVEEGWLWTAAVAGIEGVPRKSGDEYTHLRLAELHAIREAGAVALDLSRIGLTATQAERISASSVTREVLNSEKSLWDKGIVTIREGQVVSTVAGMVALGRQPYRYIPGLCVAATLEKEQICWRGNALELAAQINGTSSHCLTSGKNKFRELVLNALVHRSWRRSDWQKPIDVSVCDQVLQISHPGRMEHWQVGKSKPVNPRLFALLCELGLATGKGTGLAMVERFVLRHKLRPLRLEQREEQVCLELQWPYAVKAARIPSVPQSKPTAAAPLPSTAVPASGPPSTLAFAHSHQSRVPAQTNRPASPSAAQQTSEQKDRSNHPRCYQESGLRPASTRSPMSGRLSATESFEERTIALLYGRWLALDETLAQSQRPPRWTIGEMTRHNALLELIAQLAPGESAHRNRAFGELLKRWKQRPVRLTGLGELSGVWALVDDGPRTKQGIPYRLERRN